MIAIIRFFCNPTSLSGLSFGLAFGFMCVFLNVGGVIILVYFIILWPFVGLALIAFDLLVWFTEKPRTKPDFLAVKFWVGFNMPIFAFWAFSNITRLGRI